MAATIKTAIQRSSSCGGALTEGAEGSAEVIHNDRAGRQRPARLILSLADRKVSLCDMLQSVDALSGIIISNSAYYPIALIRSQISLDSRVRLFAAV